MCGGGGGLFSFYSLHVKAPLKALVYMILGFNYNVMDVVNAVIFYLVIISDTTNKFLLQNNTDLFNRIESLARKLILRKQTVFLASLVLIRLSISRVAYHDDQTQAELDVRISTWVMLTKDYSNSFKVEAGPSKAAVLWLVVLYNTCMTSSNIHNVVFT